MAKQPFHQPPLGWPVLFHLHGAVDDEPCMARVCVVNDSGSIEVRYTEPRSYNMARSHAIYHKDDPHLQKLPSDYVGRYGTWSWVDGMIADPPQTQVIAEEQAPVSGGIPTPPPDDFGALDDDEEDGSPVEEKPKRKRSTAGKKEETLV